MKKTNSFSHYLIEARQANNLSLEKLSHESDIELEHLINLEEGCFDKMPPDIYIRGYLYKLADVLKLDPHLLWEIYKKEKQNLKFSGQSDRLPENRFDRQSFFKIKSARTLFIILFIGLFLIYCFWQAKAFFTSPSLIVFSPAFDLVTQEETLRVNGRTDAARVFVNYQPVSLEKNGVFEAKLSLVKGLNIIKIEAQNYFGKNSVVERRVILQ